MPAGTVEILRAVAPGVARQAAKILRAAALGVARQAAEILRPTVPGVARQAVEKQGPALLKKGEEGIPIRKDGLQRPSSEGAALPEQLHQPIVQEARQSLPPVVPPQQEAQQVGGVPDEFGREVEDMPKHEVPGRVLPEPARPVAFLRSVERVEVATVEQRDDRVAESGKQIVQAEGKPPTGLHQIVGKRRPIVPLGAHDDFEAGALVPVPARPEPRFVVEGGIRRDPRR